MLELIKSKIKSGLDSFKKRDFNNSKNEFKKVLEIDSNEIISNFYLGAISFEKN